MEGMLRLIVSGFLFAVCSLVKVHSQQCERTGWHVFDDALYRTETNPATYTSARSVCRSYGGHLVSVKSHQLNWFLTRLVNGITDVETDYWIGLRSDDNPGDTFRWHDGTPVNLGLGFLQNDEPDDSGSGDGMECVALKSSSDSRNGNWYMQDCSSRRPYICKKSVTWHAFGSSLYYKEANLSTYDEARLHCQCLGGDLAQLKTRAINDFVSRIPGGPWFWFGLDDRHHEGTFVWVDGTVFGTSFPSWSVAQPDNFRNREHCVHTTTITRWNDVDCDNSYKFVCEKSIVPEPTRKLARLLAVTRSPYGGGLDRTGFMCLQSPPYDEREVMVNTRKLIKLGESTCDDTITVPGVNALNALPVLVNQSLPADNEAVGIFQCTADTDVEGSTVPVSVAILSQNRRFQPSDGRFTKIAYVGDNVTLSVSEREEGWSSDIRWRKFRGSHTSHSLPVSDGRTSHTIQFATVNDAAVYGTFVDGNLGYHRLSLIRLIILECPRGRWDPPSCLGACDQCYNGGICDQDSGTCICPPGFAGPNCLKACGKDQFGWECELQCGPGQLLEVCVGSEFCMPDPYGCNCLAGYTGVYCNETCRPGQFGVDCTEECHCSQGSPCDSYTGECPGDCADGWSGPGCRVPAVCPVGFYGVNCTEQCKCLNNTACDKDTGYCLQSDGKCAVGFSADSSMTQNCALMSGCFASCSKTCHCSGGANDCDSVTGTCFSSKCHPQWTGEKCQVDRFVIQSRKANPGQAVSFSCAVSPASDGQLLAPEDIKVAVIDGVADFRMVPHVSSYVSCKTRQNTFLLENIRENDTVYCYVGVLGNDSSFAYARVHLPSFDTQLESTTPSLTTLRTDSPTDDTDDGPVGTSLRTNRPTDDDIKGDPAARNFAHDVTSRRELTKPVLTTSRIPEDSPLFNQSGRQEKQTGQKVYSSSNNSSSSWTLFAISLIGNVVFVLIIIVLGVRLRGSKSESQGFPLAMIPTKAKDRDTCEDLESYDNVNLDSYSIDARILK